MALGRVEEVNEGGWRMEITVDNKSLKSISIRLVKCDLARIQGVVS